MLSFEDIGIILDDIVDDLPEDFHKELNGGIYLLPDTKLHSQSRPSDKLYILGEYHSRFDLGKYISIYYGSFIKVYSGLSPAEHKEKLREIVYHEFTHHFEILAGEKGLEIKDDDDLEKYLHGGNEIV